MIRSRLREVVVKLYGEHSFDVLVPPTPEMGDYSLNAAFVLAKLQKTSPQVVAQELCEQLAKALPEEVERCQVAGPGFVNVFLRANYLQSQVGHSEVEQVNKGKRVMVEYTQANPFKQFHIGHLMNNAIGESIARVYEALGAEVIRVNYQGDVGVHVADSVWGMMQLQSEMPQESDSPADRMAFLGKAYALGATAYKEDPHAKAAIDALNKHIYEKNDEKINELYQRGRTWSLDYFETMYVRLGTKFIHYFFESEAGPAGVRIVQAHPKLFIESQGAVIFPGENYGLHSRVFITSLGLPTYEAKELGVNKAKFDEYHPDLSIVVTGNEINEYFKVLLKAMELVLPEVAARTKHIGHGMLRLPTGKMSSRTGDVITADHLIAEMQKVVTEKMHASEDVDLAEQQIIKEKVSMAALRYPILKQSIGKDIIFDFESSVSATGDSGPYLQYTYARLSGIARKINPTAEADMATLVHPTERMMMRHLLDLDHAVQECTRLFALNGLALYLYELATLANRYYEEVRLSEDTEVSRQAARLQLVAAVAATLKQGLALLGIEALERI